MQILTCLVQTNPCPIEQQSWTETAQIDLMLNGGFSPEAFELAVTACFLIWATGLGIGLIIGLIRKTRVPGR